MSATITLSNTLADLAERVKEANRASVIAIRQSADKAIEAGMLLIEAKAAVQHGEWLPFLQRADLPERHAQRLMQLARSGLQSDSVTDLGGMVAALTFLSQWRLPAFEESLMINSAARQRELEIAGEWEPSATALIWESAEHPGHYHIAAIDDGESIVMTKGAMKPMIERGLAQPVNTIVYWLTQHFVVPIDDWYLDFMERANAELILGDAWTKRLDPPDTVSDLGNEPYAVRQKRRSR